MSFNVHGRGQRRFELEALEPRVLLSASEGLANPGPPAANGFEYQLDSQELSTQQPAQIQEQGAPGFAQAHSIGDNLFQGLATADLEASTPPTQIREEESESPKLVDRQSVNLTSPNVDLTVLTPAVSATTTKANDTVTVSWSVKNLGTETVTGQWLDGVFLSTDDKLDLRQYGQGPPGPGGPEQGGDQMLFQLFHSEPLGAGATYAVSTQPPNPSTQIQIGIPNAPAGDYFLLFGVDRSNESWSDDKIRETNETNNVFAVPIEVTAPAVDLQISAPSAPADAIAGGAIEVAWTVTNAGTDPANGVKSQWEQGSFWQDGVYLSDDNQFDPQNDVLLSSRRSDSPLSPGGLYRATATVTLRSNAVGSKYLFIVADTWNRQSETNETNNVSVAMPIQITPPAVDLVMSTPAAPANAVQGAPVDLAWTVTNAGQDPTQTSSMWSDSVFLSDDNVYSQQTDQMLSQRWNFGALNARAQYRATVTVTVPAGVVGAKFLFFVADNLNLQAETNETNNVSDPIPILIMAPSVDLMVTSATLSATTVRPSVGFTVNYTVANQGATSTTNNWVDYFYFSSKGVWDASAVLLDNYSFSGPALAAQGSYNVSRMLFLPANTALGDGHILIVVDKNNTQVETDETNNSKDLPLQVARPDLQLLSVSAPVSALPGETVTVSWTAKNASSFRVGMLWDYVYLSTDNVLDAGDLYLSNAVRFSALEANANYNASATFALPADKTPGAYYFIVQIDRANEAGDGDLTNNVKAVPFQLGKAPDLAANDLTAPAQAQLG